MQHRYWNFWYLKINLDKKYRTNDCTRIKWIGCKSQFKTLALIANKPVFQINQHRPQLCGNLFENVLPAFQIQSSSAPPPAFCWGTLSPPPPASSWFPPCPWRSCPRCSPAPPPAPPRSSSEGWTDASCWCSSCWVFSGESRSCRALAVWGFTLAGLHSSCVMSDILGYLVCCKNLKKSFVSNYVVELLTRSGRREGAYQLGWAQAPESYFSPITLEKNIDNSQWRKTFNNSQWRKTLKINSGEKLHQHWK